MVGNYAYVAGWDDDGVQILDISDPTNPTAVGSITDDATTELDGAYHIKVVGNYAYVAGWDDDGVQILDISDPTNPTAVGSITDDATTELDGAHRIEVRGNYAYVASSFDDGIEIIDIGGASLTSAEIGSLKVSDVQVDQDLRVSQSLYVENSVNIGEGGLLVSGDAGFTGNISQRNSAVFKPLGNLVDDGTLELQGAREVEVVGNYAYVLGYGDSGFQVVDVSDPSNPTGVANIQHSGATPLQLPQHMDIVGNYAYIGAIGDVLAIIDISNPLSPVYAGHYDGPLSQNVEDVYVEGNYAYTTNRNNDRLQIFDISNPASISLVSSIYPGENDPQGIVKSGNYVYITSALSGRLRTIDVSNPASPVIGSGLNLGGAYEIALDGDRLYTTLSSGRMNIIDISTPATPSVISTFQDSAYSFLDIDLVGSTLYAVDTTLESVVAIDVSDQNNPTFIANYVDDASTEMITPYSIDVADNKAYIGGFDSDSLQIFDVTSITLGSPTASFGNITAVTLNTTSSVMVGGGLTVASNASVLGNASIAGTLNVTGNTTLDGTLTVNNSVIFATSSVTFQGHNGCAVLSTSVGGSLQCGSIQGALLQPVYDDQYQGDLDPRQTVIVGNYAYTAAAETNSLEITDISDPAGLTVVGSLVDDGTTLLQSPYGVAISGNYAYVASNVDDALQVIDISNPASPSAVASLANGTGGALLNGAYDIDVIGNYAYVVSQTNSALQIIDISAPASPTATGNIADSGTRALFGARDVEVSGNYAYVAGYDDNGVEIIDISSPASPTHVAALFDTTDSDSLLTQPTDIEVYGDYLIVASEGEDGITVIDVSVPATPTIVSSVSSIGDPEDIELKGNLAYIAAGGNIIVVDLSNIFNPVLTESFDPSAEVTQLFNSINVHDVVLTDDYIFYTTIESAGVRMDSFVRLEYGELNVPRLSVQGISATGTLSVQGNATFGSSISVANDVTIGDAITRGSLSIYQPDDAVSDHIAFYNGSTRVGEIGAEDNTWLRINQETSKNIYTPRYFRADGGLYVDNTTFGINGSGRLLSNSLSGTYANNLTFSGTTTANEINLSTDNITGIDQIQFTEGSDYSIEVNTFNELAFDVGDGSDDLVVSNAGLRTKALTVGIDNGSEALISNSLSTQDLKVQVIGSGDLILDTGTGVIRTEAQLNVVGPSGAVPSYPAVGAQDALVVENNNNSNIGVIAGAGLTSSLKFYENAGTNSFEGIVRYDHSTDTLGLGANALSDRLVVGGSSIDVNVVTNFDSQIHQPYSDSTAYNVWIQGSVSGSLGDDRNLALLGVENMTSDYLVINYGDEYDCLGVGTTSCSASYDLDVLGSSYGGTARYAARFRRTTDGNTIRVQDTAICNGNPQTTGFTWSCSSDERLKTNIVDTGDALDYIDNFRIRNYTEIASGDDTTGVIAQEVLAHNPELVELGDNGYYTVEGINEWIVIKAVQQLNSAQEVLNTEVDALEVAVADNTARIEALEAAVFDSNFTDLTVTNTATIANLTVTGDVAVAGNITVEGDTQVLGALTVEGKIISAGDQATVDPGADLNADDPNTTFIQEGNDTVSIDGNDTAGTITFTVDGASTTADGELAIVEFSSPYAEVPRIALTPLDADALNLRFFIEKTTDGFVLKTPDTVTPGTTYTYDYIVIQ